MLPRGGWPEPGGAPDAARGPVAMPADTGRNGVGKDLWRQRRTHALGERFSAADVMVGSTAAFMRMFDIMPASGAINAYIDRCLARPACQKALALDQSA